MYSWNEKCSTEKLEQNKTRFLRLLTFCPNIFIFFDINVKVKVFRNRPEGPEGGRGIALLFLILGTRRGEGSAPRPGRFSPGKEPVPIVQEDGWAAGPVWTCAKNLASSIPGLSSPWPIVIPNELSRPPLSLILSKQNCFLRVVTKLLHLTKLTQYLLHWA
jgi:hypothetical protein